MCHWEGHFPFDSFYKYWTNFENLENAQIYTQIFKFKLACMNWSPFYVNKMCYIFVLCNFEIQAWILERKWL